MFNDFKINTKRVIIFIVMVLLMVLKDLKSAILKSTAIIAIVLADAGSAWAVQRHPGDEGFDAHMMAHLFLIASMLYLFVVLGKPSLRLSGWKLIRLAALFFLLWNVDVSITHITGRLMEPKGHYLKGSWLLVEDLKTELYYVTRLTEYFFLVPAFLFMALGLRRLETELKREKE